MDRIQEHFASKIPAAQAEIKTFLAEHGEKVIGEIKVSQIYQGMRGMPASDLRNEQAGSPRRAFASEATASRNCRSLLPAYPGGQEPLPEGLFYLILMNELPTDDDVRRVSNNWARRAIVPPHVFKTIDALPSSHAPDDAVRGGRSWPCARKANSPRRMPTGSPSRSTGRRPMKTR